nr:hypothetical protein BaRGS_000148 [Batillaria attramentaria]
MGLLTAFTMEIKQFLGLQVFEFAYLMALAFLPFFVAQREVGLTIMMVAFVYIVFAVIKMALTRRIDPANKVVLVTGCDTGFGNALARRLNSLGFTVVAGCLDKSSEGAELLKSCSTGHLHVLQLDITEEDSVNSCVTFLREQFPGKGLWALVNNAGIMSLGDVEFTTVDSYKKVADVNLFGMIRITKACLPLIRAEKGRVINMSGAAGRLSLPSMSAFSVSNFGIEAFSDALRLEMRKFGVKVVVVEPGNFYGSTGLQNRSALPGIQSEFDFMWENAPEQVKQVYGRGYIDSQYKAVAELTKTAPSSLAPVVDTVENAVMQIRIGSRYLIDGSNQVFDFPNAGKFKI